VCDDCGPIAAIRHRRGVAVRDVARHDCSAPPARRRPPAAAPRRKATRHVTDDSSGYLELAAAVTGKWCRDHSFTLRGTMLDDYRAEALYGIASALTRYDPTRGTPLTPYLWQRAYGAITDHVRATSAVRRTDHVRGLTPETTAPHRRPAITFTDLAGDDPTRVTVIPDPASARAFDAVDNADAVHRLLAVLNPNQRYVIEECDLGGMKLHEAAAVLGVTESRACQIRKAALHRMRAVAR
jgi:RNA polymerase sigma factor (sigma-70 family)